MAEPSLRVKKGRVLCVDDDRDVAEVVEAILTDEGYDVSCLYDVKGDLLRTTVGRLEPDCVLLDGVPGKEYGSWDSAAWLEQRHRGIPVVMFTAHHLDATEAQESASERSQHAGFAAVVEKPFHIDELLKAVATAVGRSEPFDSGPEAEAGRTDALVSELSARGASDIAPSTRREWVTFRDPKGTLWQIYWWQARGVYQVGSYGKTGKMTMSGQFTDLAVAIDAALPE